MPSTTEEWEKIATEFETSWNFPHCIGALDGKHVHIYAPDKSGSLFFNYKKTFSIVLMAMADASYKFTYVDVGANGRISDGGVYNNSSLSAAIQSNTLGIPPPKPLVENDDSTIVPYVIVADDAFALSANLMKPYAFSSMDHAQRIFNYRLSRARRIIENVFGILSAKFRILRTAIYLNPEKVTAIVLALCAMHNWLITTNAASYAPAGTFDRENEADGTIIQGSWRNVVDARSAESLELRNPAHHAKQIREIYKNHFVTAGAVEWQEKMI